MIYFFRIFIASFLFLISAQFVFAKEVPVYFFRGEGCPHCAAEEEFFDFLKNDKSLDFKVLSYEIWKSPENANFLSNVARENNWNVQGVPFTVIGYKTISGFGSAETTGREIKEVIEQCRDFDCPDKVGAFIKARGAPPEDSVKEESAKKETKKLAIDDNSALATISLPWIGEIKTKDFSLPVLTIIIAAADGFNPCAMWVLIFLIGLLLNMQNRRRRWILGGAFIAASALMYFVFLAAWLKLFAFLMLIPYIKPGIGIVALVAGIYNLRDFFKNKELVCKVSNTPGRQLFFSKLKQFVYENHFWLALFGVVALAISVNLVELVCSAGLPAIFTQILTLANLTAWESYGYMLLYIIIFMLDDMIVFAIAMRTLEIKTASAKYSRYSALIGGLVMLVLGLLLIFKPEWLMF